MPSENTRRIAKNTVMLYIRMLLIMAVTLYTSRVVLNVLGVEDFGIYNVVGGVIVLFSFLNTAMSQATQRFLSFELGHQNYHALKQVFSMSLTVHMSLAVLIFLLAETIGVWFIDCHLNFPAERMEAVHWVYQFSILTFLIQILQVPYNASIIAHERMTFYAYISVIEAILKLAVVFLLQCITWDKLKLYAVFVCSISFFMLWFYRFYCLKNFKECHYRFFWNKSLYRRLLGFSGWSIFGSLSVIATNQGTNILLNVFFGVVVNAAMGIANQVVNAVNLFVSNLQMAFNPQITKSYALGDRMYLMALVFRGAKISFFLLWVIALPILLKTEIVLLWWLKVVPEYSVYFCRLFLISVLIDTLSGPLWMLVQATGEIRKYQLIISFLFWLSILFALFFLKWGYLPYVVLYIRIVLSCVLLFTRLILLKSMIRFPAGIFIRDVIGRCVLVMFVTFIIVVLCSELIQNIWEFVLFVLFVFSLCGIIIFVLGFNHSERLFIRTAVIKTFNKLKREKFSRK